MKGVTTHESEAEPGTREVVSGIGCPSHHPPCSLGLGVSGPQPVLTDVLGFFF